MNRRKFLKRLGIGVATAAVVAVSPKFVEPETFTGTFDTLNDIKTSKKLDVATIRRIRQELISRNVYPNAMGSFSGVVHPLKIKNVVVDHNDPLVGSWVSYKFHYTVAHPPDRKNWRIRSIGV